MEHEFISVEEFAKEVNVTRQAVEAAIKSERLPKSAYVKTKAGNSRVTLINKNEALQAWLGTAKAHLNGGNRDKARAKVSELEGEQSGGIGNEPTSYREAERREKVAKAAKAQLELLELQGKLVRKDVVYRQLYDAGQQLSEAILAVPARISKRIAKVGGDEFDIENIMTEALNKTLEDLTEIKQRKLG